MSEAPYHNLTGWGFSGTELTGKLVKHYFINGVSLCTTPNAKKRVYFRANPNTIQPPQAVRPDERGLCKTCARQFGHLISPYKREFDMKKVKGHTKGRTGRKHVGYNANQHRVNGRFAKKED